MTISIDQDLKDVLNKLDQRFDKVDQKLEALAKDVTDLKVGQVRLEEKLSGEIKALDIKVDGIDKRLEKVETSQKNQIWALISILSTVVLAAVIRFVLSGLPQI